MEGRGWWVSGGSRDRQVGSKSTMRELGLHAKTRRRDYSLVSGTRLSAETGMPRSMVQAPASRRWRAWMSHLIPPPEARDRAPHEIH